MKYFKLVLFTHILCLSTVFKECVSRDISKNYLLHREQRRCHDRHSAERARFHVPLWILLFLIMLSTVFCLIVLGKQEICISIISQLHLLFLL